LIRTRSITAVFALAMLSILAGARSVWAAPEIHRFNVVISSIATQVAAEDFNDAIDFYNKLRLRPRGLQNVKEVTFGFLHGAELSYFVRPNVTVNAGFGQLRGQTSQEFLPAIGQDIQIRAEMLSVPVHVGAAYYLAPYTQGDFQARAYLGAGFLSNYYNRATFEQVETNTDSLTTLGGTSRSDGTRDGPGYYVEFGAHMFFAVRYSVQISAIYRSAVVRELVDINTHEPIRTPDGKPFSLDTSGLGAKLGFAIGL
jgi:hypothetical protein